MDSIAKPFTTVTFICEQSRDEQREDDP